MPDDTIYVVYRNPHANCNVEGCKRKPLHCLTLEREGPLAEPIALCGPCLEVVTEQLSEARKHHAAEFQRRKDDARNRAATNPGSFFGITQTVNRLTQLAALPVT